MPTDGATKRPASDDQPLAELRAILLGPDREAWDALRQRLDNPSRRAEDVAGVLAEAVRLRSDAKLRRALQPLLEEALQLSVQSNPRMLADALFPIFGKAIRRAITSELDSMLQSLSQTLEQSFTWRSLRWRWESFRTGRRYAEIVMLRSLLFRVEQVFLIHRKTGLLLQHVAAAAAEAKDPEMVSGMLTAIQDFVRDSVSGAETENLETIRMGETGVVLAYGPDAILAGFVRGVAPRNLTRRFQDTLDAIEQTYAEALHAFDGDTAEFEECRPQLAACLVGQGRAEERRATSRAARALLFGTPLLLLAVLAGWWISSTALERRWANFAHRLSGEPGIVLVSAEKRGGTYYISGLRDPLASDPAVLLRAADLDAKRAVFHWEEYHSLEPRFAGRRRVEELKQDVERRAFRFATGSAEVPPGQQFLLDDVAAQILALTRAAASVGQTVQVEVRGNHDPVGTEQFNSMLARARAENVRAALISLGVPASRMSAVPEDRDHETCSAVNDEERLFCRSASFRVIGIP
ncbi:MAG TPA: OmpA family protein [Bryobacteraceae bacterium]|nr:OmpA family protein [Bryobacteraceae bacterium]HUO29653.1 OmpA family protein [Bryobacteraceae bacterium]